VGSPLPVAPRRDAPSSTMARPMPSLIPSSTTSRESLARPLVEFGDGREVHSFSMSTPAGALAPAAVAAVPMT
jgi:hypothetical protein